MLHHEEQSKKADENECMVESKPSRGDRLKAVLGIVLMIITDLGLPLTLYYVLKMYIPETWALMASSAPAIILAIIGLIFKGRANITGIILIVSFAASAVIATLKNDPRLYLLREAITTGTLGLVFLISLVPIRIGSFKMRPIMFYISRDMATGGSFGISSSKGSLPGLTEDEPVDERWERFWNSSALFRHGYIVKTAVWAVGFLIEVPVRVFIVFNTDSIDKAFLLTNIITYPWIGILMLFNFIYGIRVKKQKKKMIAEVIAAASDSSNVDYDTNKLQHNQN